MFKHYRVLLAGILLVFLAGVVLFSNQPTAYLVSAGGGEGGGADTTKPTVTVSGPTSINVGSSALISASAYDNAWVISINIYIDNSLRKTCTFTGSPSGSCTYTATLAAGTHNYYATAVDLSDNKGATATKSLTVKNPTTAVTIPVEPKTASYARSIEIPLDQEYLNVDKIYFSGTPGGEVCTAAAINLKAKDASGAVVGEATTGRVSTHSSASGTLYTSGSKKVKTLVGTTTGGALYCGYIDKLNNLYLAISDDKNGPKISTKVSVTQVPVKYASGYGADKVTSYTLSASASDPSGISKINMSLDSAAVSTTCAGIGTASATCSYTSSSIPGAQTTMTFKVESFDNTLSKNKNIYTTTFKIGQFMYCLGC